MNEIQSKYKTTCYVIALNFPLTSQKNILMMQYVYKGAVLRDGEFVKFMEYFFII